MPKINPNDFLLNTDYEMDKIILVKTGEFINEINIKNELDFAPLIFGIWSENQDFTFGNTIGAVPSVEPIPGLYTPPLAVGGRAFKDRIYLYASGEGSSTKTIYYKLYAFAPDSLNIDAPTTANYAKQFLLNTDYNYRKIKATGEFTLDNSAYRHDLGYIPQVMAWIKYSENEDLPAFSNAIEPLDDFSEVTSFGLVVNETEISCQLGTIIPGIIDKIIWRIYYDEA